MSRALMSAAVIVMLFAPPLPAGERAFFHSVHPCIGEGAAPEARGRANSGIQCWMGVEALRFEHWLDTYCDAAETLSVHVSVTGRTITVRETYAGNAVRCRCVFKIEGGVKYLRSGRYRIRVLFDDRRANSLSEIEEAAVVVP